jgi:hypothetical protein
MRDHGIVKKPREQGKRAQYELLKKGDSSAFNADELVKQAINRALPKNSKYGAEFTKDEGQQITKSIVKHTDEILGKSMSRSDIFDMFGIIPYDVTGDKPDITFKKRMTKTKRSAVAL